MNRRDLLSKCAAMGVLSFAATLGVSEASAAWDASENKTAKDKLTPTPPSELGPFYKTGAPATTDLRQSGDVGLPLEVSGAVYNTRGEALQNAKIEIWQANHDGAYDLQGYRYRAVLKPDAQGSYSFRSVMPGHYPARVCQHVHYLVTAPGCEPLVTQLYFATDPAFDGDPDKNFNRDPLIWSRELVRPVQLKGDPKDMIAAVRFEVVLEQL